MASGNGRNGRNSVSKRYNTFHFTLDDPTTLHMSGLDYDDPATDHKDTSKKDSPKKETSKKVTSKNETSKNETPKKETPKKDAVKSRIQQELSHLIPDNLDFVISVEHCCNCDSHGPSLRHDLKKYVSNADSCLRQLAEIMHRSNLSIRFGVMRRRIGTEARIGAFEVCCAFRDFSGEVICESFHSKLETLHWPSRAVLEKRLQEFITSHGVPRRVEDDAQDLWTTSPLADSEWKFSSDDGTTQTTTSNGTLSRTNIFHLDAKPAVFWVFDWKEYPAYHPPENSLVRVLGLLNPNGQRERRPLLGTIASYCPMTSIGSEELVNVQLKYFPTSITIPISSCRDDEPALDSGPSFNDTQTPPVLSVILLLSRTRTLGLRTSKSGEADVSNVTGKYSREWAVRMEGDVLMFGHPCLCRASLFQQLREFVADIEDALFPRLGESEPRPFYSPVTGDILNLQDVYSESVLDWVFRRSKGMAVDMVVLEDHAASQFLSHLEVLPNCVDAPPYALPLQQLMHQHIVSKLLIQFSHHHIATGCLDKESAVPTANTASARWVQLLRLTFTDVCIHLAKGVSGAAILSAAEVTQEKDQSDSSGRVVGALGASRLEQHVQLDEALLLLPCLFRALDARGIGFLCLEDIKRTMFLMMPGECALSDDDFVDVFMSMDSFASGQISLDLLRKFIMQSVEHRGLGILRRVFRSHLHVVVESPHSVGGRIMLMDLFVDTLLKVAFTNFNPGSKLCLGWEHNVRTYPSQDTFRLLLDHFGLSHHCSVGELQAILINYIHKSLETEGSENITFKISWIDFLVWMLWNQGEEASAITQRLINRTIKLCQKEFAEVDDETMTQSRLNTLVSDEANSRLQIPVILWDVPEPIVYGTPLSTQQLNAVAIDSVNECSVAGVFRYHPDVTSVLPAGEHELRVVFSPEAANKYRTVEKIVNLVVTKFIPIVHWDEELKPLLVGQELTDSHLNARCASDVPGSFYYSRSVGYSFSHPGTFEITATFVPQDTNYAQASVAASIHILHNPNRKDVNEAAPKIISPVVKWPALDRIVYGTALSATQLSACAWDGESKVVGAYRYDPDKGTVLNAGKHTLRVQFIPQDTLKYGLVDASVELVVNRCEPRLVWEDYVSTIKVGEELSEVHLNAYCLDSIPGTFYYSHPYESAFSHIGQHSITATFIPSEPFDLNYKQAVKVVKMNVITAEPARPVLVWDEPTDIEFGQALTSEQLNAVCLDEKDPSEVPGTMEYSPPEGTILPTGTHDLIVKFIPEDQDCYCSVEMSVHITVNKVRPRIVWPEPQNVITVGDELDTNILNAYCADNIPGTFVYSKSYGYAYSQSGVQEISTTFTPDDTNFEVVTASIFIHVCELPPLSVMLAWNNPSNIDYGVALSDEQLCAHVMVEETDQDLDGVFTYSPPSGTILNAGVHTLFVEFISSDSSLPCHVTKSVTLTVLKNLPTIAWELPDFPVVVGEPLTASQLRARCVEEIDGVMFYSRSFGYIFSEPGLFDVVATFVPKEPFDVNYKQATKKLFFTVVSAGNNIEVAWNIDEIEYGTPLSEKILCAKCLHHGTVEPIAGRIVYGNAYGEILCAGKHLLSMEFIPLDRLVYSGFKYTKEINVIKRIPDLYWDPQPLETIFVGDALTETQLCACVESDLDGQYFYSHPLGYVFSSAGVFDITLIFLPTDSMNYSQATITNTIEVKVAVHVTEKYEIFWKAPSPIVYGTPLSEEHLNATCMHTLDMEPVSGSFTYTPPMGTVLNAGIHELKAEFIADDPSINYVFSSTVEMIVHKAEPSLCWDLVDLTVVVGEALSEIQLNAICENNIDGVVFYSKSYGYVFTKPGVFEITATFIPAEPFDVNYKQVSKVEMLTVCLAEDLAKAVIVWDTLAPILYGEPLTSKQLCARCVIEADMSDVPGTLKFVPELGYILDAGVQNLTVIFTPDDPIRYPLTYHKTVQLRVEKLQPVVVWEEAKQPMYLGQKLSETHLNASVEGGLKGNFLYSPSLGHIFETAGTFSLNTIFFPEDQYARNYKQASKTINVIVLESTNAHTTVMAQLRWIPPSPISVGMKLGPEQLCAECIDLEYEMEVEGSYEYHPSFDTFLPEGEHTLRVVFLPKDKDKYGPIFCKEVVLVVNKEPKRFPAGLRKIIESAVEDTPSQFISRKLVFHRLIVDGRLLKRCKYGDVEARLRVVTDELVPVEMYKFDRVDGVTNFHFQSKYLNITSEQFSNSQMILSLRGRSVVNKQRIEFYSTVSISLEQFMNVRDGPFTISLFAYPKLYHTDTRTTLMNDDLHEKCKLRVSLIVHAFEPMYAVPLPAAPSTPVRQRPGSAPSPGRKTSPNGRGGESSSRSAGKKNLPRGSETLPGRSDPLLADGFTPTVLGTSTWSDHPSPKLPAAILPKGFNTMTSGDQHTDEIAFGTGRVPVAPSTARPRSAPLTGRPFHTPAPVNVKPFNSPTREMNHILPEEVHDYLDPNLKRWPLSVQGTKLASPRKLPKGVSAPLPLV